MTGSLHCLGMCGPLILSLPQQGQSKVEILSRKLLYHLARTWVYVVLGTIAGLLGQKLEMVLPDYFHSTISIICGLVILISVVYPSHLKMSPLPKFSKPFQTLLHDKSLASELVQGMLNGLLPCGMVYLALTVAFGLGSTLKAMLLMLSFGLGTIPLLLSLSLLKCQLTLKSRPWMRKIKPAALVLCSLLLLLRGFGVPLPHMNYFQTDLSKTSHCPACHVDE